MWYRWALHNPNVSVAIMAPDDRAELDENLSILKDCGRGTPRSIN
jgi:hypothetical protein